MYHLCVCAPDINTFCCVILYIISMERILERYERYSYAERQLVPNDDHTSPVCQKSLLSYVMCSVTYIYIYIYIVSVT